MDGGVPKHYILFVLLPYIIGAVVVLGGGGLFIGWLIWG